MQRQLDGFSSLELVGFGGSGEVWRARPDGGGADVALKWLTDQSVDTELLTAEPLNSFAHEHVAKLLEVRPTTAGVVLVEAFVAGGSLAGLLAQRTQLGCAEVVTLLTPVAEALAAAHEAGLVHGNLSPASILFTPDGRPMVTDLGVWPALTPESRPSPRLDYLDPSVARGALVDEASDVFAIAAIGLHALTGRPPWNAETGPAAWQLTADGEGVDLSSLQAVAPAPLAAVIARGLSDQPHSRGRASDFAADVRAALEPEPLHLSGPFVWPDLPPSPDRDAEELALERIDIAGAVRRAASARPAGSVPATGPARHAATARARRTPRAEEAGIRRLGRRALRRLRSSAASVSRQALVGVGVTLAILAVIVVGLGWNTAKVVPAQSGSSIAGSAADAGTGHGPAETTRAGGEGAIDERHTPDSREGWMALLRVLYQRRAAAFETGAAALLDQVFAADSPQLVTDTAEVERLVAAGQVLRGFAPRVLGVLDIALGEDRATLRITDTLPDYETVPMGDVGAPALASTPGRGPATVSMILVRTEDGWRIHTAARLA